MRTTIDLPEDLHRTLKARAGLSGVSLSELVRGLVERGLKSPAAEGGRHSAPPPVIIRRTGRAIPALGRAKLRQLEEEEDEAKHARST